MQESNVKTSRGAKFQLGAAAHGGSPFSRQRRVHVAASNGEERNALFGFDLERCADISAHSTLSA